MYGMLLLSVLVADPGYPLPQTPETGEPVSFTFNQHCGPRPGHKEAYDPRERVYYLDVSDIAHFGVKSVNNELGPVVLRITGMLDKPEGPLSLTVPSKKDKQYEHYSLYHVGYDKKLFHIDRKNGVTTVEFLPEGKKLLQPGASFGYIDAFRN